MVYEDFSRFLQVITGQQTYYKQILGRKRSSFVSLTLPSVEPALDSLSAVVVGTDAVELRVDLLQDPNGRGRVPSVVFLVEQVSLLRMKFQLPLIFTIRTKSQGGAFPDEAREEALELYLTAIRMGFEFVDLEMQFPEDFLQRVIESKGSSKIIASHHDPQNLLSWANGSWIPHYNKALQCGDIIKLVGVADCMEDNFALFKFKSMGRGRP